MLDRCTASSARLMCASRREAIRDGSIFYSSHHQGWIWPAENRAVPRAMRERHAQPFVWRYCPFCGGALPDEVSAAEQLLEKPPEWTDEDGG